MTRFREIDFNPQIKAFLDNIDDPIARSKIIDEANADDQDTMTYLAIWSSITGCDCNEQSYREFKKITGEIML